MKALGIILAGGSNYRMKELSKKRAIAAMPMAGGYRAIDFALSNMTNSRVNKVAVLTQFNSRSLNEHLNSSKWWNFGRKNGGLFIFTPTITNENGNWYRGTADAMAQNLDFLKKSHEPYVVIAAGDGIYKLDYNKVLDYHIEKNADITIVCRKADPEDDLSRFGVIEYNENNRITVYDQKPIQATNDVISCGIYVLQRRLLIELLEQSIEERRFDFVTDIIIRYKNAKNIVAYMMDGYWKNISSVESYYDCNMDFLKPDVRKYFFRDEPAVYSKVDDLAPAKYNDGAHVRNSLISSGTIINASIEDSVVFKNVYIGENCYIKNSIILNDVYIGDNCRIENCIVESRDSIEAGSVFVGEGAPLVVTGHKIIR